MADTLPFDLIILDLDGTILDLYHAGDMSPTVCRTVDAVQAAGIPVTIATGRTLDYVRAHVSHLGVKTPVVTTQGALIGDPVSGVVLDASPMPLAAARRIAAWIDGTQPISALYLIDDSGRTHVYQNRTGPDPDFYDHVFGLPRDMASSFEHLLDTARGLIPIKFIAINDPTKEEDIAFPLQCRFDSELTITRTHPVLVEGTACGIDKGHGVLRLCELLGVNPARVLAIGDSDNDIPMLEAVGFGVAMGNASPGVKAVADWLAPPIEDDGAAVALRLWILDRL